MKRKLMQLSIFCALGMLSFQALGGEGFATGNGRQHDCSKITDTKKRARCEEAGRAMSACEGRRGDDYAACVKYEHAKNN